MNFVGGGFGRLNEMRLVGEGRISPTAQGGLSGVIGLV